MQRLNRTFPNSKLSSVYIFCNTYIKVRVKRKAVKVSHSLYESYKIPYFTILCKVRKGYR
jgi:hypothetical protein